MVTNFINRAFGRVSLRGSCSCRGLEAARCWPLDLDRYVGGRERAWDSTGDRAQGGFTSPAWALGCCDPGLAADLSCRYSAGIGLAR